MAPHDTVLPSRYPSSPIPRSKNAELNGFKPSFQQKGFVDNVHFSNFVTIVRSPHLGMVFLISAPYTFLTLHENGIKLSLLKHSEQTTYRLTQKSKEQRGQTADSSALPPRMAGGPSKCDWRNTRYPRAVLI